MRRTHYILRTLAASALLFSVSAISAPAADWVIFTGITDDDRVPRDDRYVLGAEYHAEPFAQLSWGDLSFGVAAVGHTNGDYWIGAGLSAMIPLKNRWFVEASLMPGLYDAANFSTDLGSDFEFRSMIGVGRWVSDRTSLSLGITHKSNAGISDVNPGVNTITLRLRRSY